MVGKLIEKKEIAQGTLKTVFEVTEPFSFKAGQYCFITLSELKYPDERGLKRHFSIVNSPNEKGIITFTTRITKSGFKKTLKDLPEGSEVNLGPIAGAFVLPAPIKSRPESKIKPLVFIAGGIGITPFMSMLKFVKEESLPYIITLIYSNRNQSSTVFLSELQQLSAQIPNFKLIPTMTADPNWTGEERMIDAQFIKDYFPDVNENYYMVVGPPPMVEAVNKTLSEAGAAQENIKIEKFTGY